MKAWRLAILGVLIAASSFAGVDPNYYVTRLLFGGSNTDSLEQSSQWIEVRGAKRIDIRTWSTHAAFSATGADSSFSDSITTFTVLFSDSLSHTTTGFPVAADCVVINPAVARTNVPKGIGVYGPLPINRQLRAPFSGSGLVMPTIGALGPDSVAVDNGRVITAKYMRIKVTPLRRLKGLSSESTAPETFRVNGLKGLRMVAHIYYDTR